MLMVGFAALFTLNTRVEAAGTQQTEEYVAVDLTAYFDPDNIVNTSIPVPITGDKWFDEATNTLYTFGATDWDSGTVLPTTQPGSPVEGDRWFDEDNNLLYSYTTEWDAGVELPVADPSLTYGQSLSFASDVGTMEGHTFLYWEVNDAINYLPVDHQFVLAKTNVLKAVFSPSDKHVVTFVDANGKILDIQYVTNDGTATPPETLPTKPGYTIAETAWNQTLTNVTTDMVAVLQYDPSNTTSYTLSVDNGTGDGSITYNHTATVVADSTATHMEGMRWFDETTDKLYTYESGDWNAGVSVPVSQPESPNIGDMWYNETYHLLYTYDGSKWGPGEMMPTSQPATLYFHHWEVDDNTVSYQSSYTFTVFENTTITARYSTTAPSDLPRVSLNNDLKIRSGYKTYLGQFYLPEGYTMVEVGIMTHATNTALIDLGTSGAVRHASTKYNALTNEFVMSIVEANAGCARAYLIYKNTSNELGTVYSESAYNIVNGGFETGDLNGWNALSIWKGESGMYAYVNDLVVNGTYFSGNPYNRDGSYNYGVEGGSVTWDQSSERMGYLRSSDFILGGSGWVSFKIGGGKTNTTAFVSIKRTSDDVEVARFGNPNFNDTGKAAVQYGSSISNAEAFLFQYYFDLGSIGTLGESYYFMLNDMAAYDWCILSADSFISYYETAPSTNADTLASNIVPSVNQAGSATNSIVNGYFDDSLNNWDNANNIFMMDSGKARSDNGGDAALGVMRSTAFTINGSYQYLRFGWDGGMDYDKRVYISIREVGTNIEVLRVTPREELGNDTNGLDNHMVNTSGLDTSKEYYLELVDNCTSSWGFQMVDEFRLVTSTEWHGVVDTYPGDEASYVTGLPTSFVYVKP